MGRPCSCDRVPPQGVPYTTAFCRLCYLWHYDPAYRVRWEKEIRTPVQEKDKPCPHLKRRVRDAEGKVKKRWCQTG